MSDLEFFIGVLRMLLWAGFILGAAAIVERIAHYPRKPPVYRMPYDYADDRRKAAQRNASIR